MGFLDTLPWTRKTEGALSTSLSVVEARTQQAVGARAVRGETYIPRQGYVSGIPEGGTRTPVTTMGWSQRTQLLQQLVDVYKQCVWVRTCADVIARTVTSGGLDIVPDDDNAGPNGKSPPEPPGVSSAGQLFQYINDTQDCRQFFRAVITQLVVFGDAYCEIVRVAGQPFALYILPAAHMEIVADEHGQVTGYTQHSPGTFRKPVDFDVDDIIHWSFDDPEGGLYGCGLVEGVLLPVTAWLFTEAYVKEAGRRGFPPRVHTDLQKESEKEVALWGEKYMTMNLGVHNIGTPIMSRGGGVVNNIAQLDLAQILEVKRSLRDEIVSGIGVPPHKAGIIESGNLGGGTGEAQDVNFKYNLVDPIAGIVSEKVDYSILKRGFGVQGWHSEFPGVDYRDSKTIEDIRQRRLERGAYTVNDYRQEIGKAPVDGGDDPVLILSRQIVYVKDMGSYTAAEMAMMAAPMVAAGQPVPAVDFATGITPEIRNQMQKDAAKQADMDAQAKLAAANTPKIAPVPPAQPPNNAPASPPSNASQQQPGDVAKAKGERGPDEEQVAVSESWMRAWRARRRQALKQLPQSEEVA